MPAGCSVSGYSRMEQARSFVAIELPGEIRLKLAEVESRLKSSAPSGVKWVKPDNIHLTLKFLGSVAADRTGEIAGVLKEAAQSISPFQLEIKDGGAFPDLRRVQVVWVGVSGDLAKLGRLQQRIESNLACLGFTAETRPFAPHLTLARLDRKIPLPERSRFGQAIAGTEFEIGSIKVESISLMRSQLSREGAVYSRLGLIKLT